MAFAVNIGVNASENNKVDKDFAATVELTGTLKEETSVIDPVILVKADLEDIVGCNYLHVPEFGRYYFITDISSYRRGLVQISCHVDVLMSFASEIRANKGIIRKQENNNAYNLYINDGSLVAYQNPYVLTEVFPQGFNGASFILLVAGSGSGS